MIIYVLYRNGVVAMMMIIIGNDDCDDDEDDDFDGDNMMMEMMMIMMVDSDVDNYVLMYFQSIIVLTVLTYGSSTIR
jgi:hypothetical protein